MAWMIMVSTLSGENLSLCREIECESPRDIVAMSASRSPGTSEGRWLRMAR